MQNQQFFPMKVKFLKKTPTNPQDDMECCQYVYELWTVEGKKVGAAITIPVMKDSPMPELRSCLLSTLEPEEVLKKLSDT